MSEVSRSVSPSAVLPWFAIQVRVNHERIASLSLFHQGYEVFLPAYTARHRWSDRVKKVESPLFPGYLFCRLDLCQALRVLAAPGVIRLVGLGSRPVPVDPEEVDAIQRIVRARLQTIPWNYLVGRTVRIEAGPLRGVEGVLLKLKGAQRLVVGVKLLQRSVAVEIEEGWVVHEEAVI